MKRSFPGRWGPLSWSVQECEGGSCFKPTPITPGPTCSTARSANECIVFRILPLEVSVSGLDYGQIEHMEGAAGKVGRLAAVSASTGQLLWTYDQRAAIGSVLTTAGGLVFAGDFHRHFRAFDAQSGEVLWDLPLSGPVTGYPISYARRWEAVCGRWCR